MSDPRRSLPSVAELMDLPQVAAAVGAAGHALVVQALRDVLSESRRSLTDASPPIDPDDLGDRAIAVLDRRTRRRLRPTINATGVLLHTNLGRAPLSAAAIAAITTAAGSTNLELDLDSGARGGRGAVAHESLVQLTGAEAALAVNNGAAALVLALSVLASGREVIISRGELIEIGGSFRLPEVMQTAGCRLREVGTTNRTHIEDYRQAVGPDTAAILRVHPSNFRIDGFTSRPTTAELAGVALAAGIPFIDDIGSGLLNGHPLTDELLAGTEPAASLAISEGADVVVFSGDKLLGGPQAGLIIGRSDLVDRCSKAPLARALRLDKLRLAALEATLDDYQRGALKDLPVWRMASANLSELLRRATQLAATCGGEVVPTTSVLGGGTTPSREFASWGVTLAGPAQQLSQQLREADPAVVARIIDDRLVLDLRSVPEELDDRLAAVLMTVSGSSR